MKSEKYPLISIIISNYNGVKLNILGECLLNFKKLDYPNFELILVDNSSTDNSIKIARNIFGKNKKFNIIKNSENNYSRGINLGFEKAKGEYIALFNNDIVLEKKYLQTLVSAFKKYPKLAVAQGKLLSYFNHSIIDSAGESMDIYGNPVTLGYKEKDSSSFVKEKEILSATGAACLIKKSALEKVGGYDPGFGIGYEDMDHCLRFRRSGFLIMFIPKAICYHKRGVTDLSPEVKTKVRFNFNKNRLATMIRNYPASLLFKTLPVTFLIYIGSMFWEVLIYRNLSMASTRLEAFFWVFQNIFQLLDERKEIISKSITKNNNKTLSLFSKQDLTGKTKAVIFDKISLKDIKYSIPWSYPSEIKKLIPRGSNILDIGCGDGHLMEWVNYSGNYRVIGVDINKKDLQKAAGLVTKAGSPVFDNLIFADLTKKNKFRKFDVVLCSQVVEHLAKKDALRLIEKIEKLAKKRIIIATINGFFQFDHREAGAYDVHLSGWSPEDFQKRGYKAQGQGLKIVYKPGALKDILPFFNPLFFAISFLSTPLLRFFSFPALLLISYKDIDEKL